MLTLKKRRIGLALGGGGARGLAHIGILKVLEEEGIPIHIIVGTSIGALVGGAYASGIAIEKLTGKMDEYLRSPEYQSSAIEAMAKAHGRGEKGLTKRVQDFVRNRFYMAQMMFKPGILSAEDFQAMINHFIPDIEIQETRVPFRAVSTDLVSGKKVSHSEGSLRRAIMASCAVPGAVEPLREGEELLVDGGVICLVPSTVARLEGADIVIAVVVDKDVCSAQELKTAKDVYRRACEIAANQLEDYELRDADIVIRPHVGDLHWTDFSHAQDLIGEGERAARQNLDTIRNAVPVFRPWFTLKQILRVRTGIGL